MKLLVICCRIPALECKGDQSIAFSRLKFLKNNNYDIKVICYGNLLNSVDITHKSELEKIGVSVHFIRWSPITALINLIFAALIDTKIPFQCALYKSKKFSKKILEVLKAWEPDAIYAVLVRIAENIPSGYQGSLYVELIDSMALNFSRKTKSYAGLPRLFMENETRRVKKYEKNIADISSAAFVVSNIDASTINSQKILTIPLGVNSKKIRAPEIIREPIIIFSGNMSYEPNVKSIQWFANNCWDMVQRNFPMGKLLIVGSNPTASVKKLAENNESIIVKGYVESVSKEISKATVAIAPMQLGSGMQFKILEAMACGVPVVTTPMGLGDIAAKKNEAILVAEDPTEFSRHVINLIGDSTLNFKIGAAGYQYVKNYHDIEILNTKFLNEIERQR